MMRTNSKKLIGSLKIFIPAAVLCCLFIVASAPTLAGAAIHIKNESGFSGISNGDTLVLDNDIVVTSLPLEIESSVTIDLNGHDISCSVSSAMTSDTGGLVNLLADGILIKNGSISLTQNAPADKFYAIFTDKDVSFRNVTFNIENTGSTKRTCAITDCGTVTLSETTFNMVNNKPTACYEVKLPGASTLNLKGMLEGDLHLLKDQAATINELPADPPLPSESETLTEPETPSESETPTEPETPSESETLPEPTLASPSDAPEPAAEPESEAPAESETATGPDSPGTVITDDVTPKHSTEKRSIIIAVPQTEAETHSWQKINGKWTYCGEVNDGK